MTDARMRHEDRRGPPLFPAPLFPTPRSPGSIPPSLRSAALSLEARRALAGLLPLIDDPEVHDVLVQVADENKAFGHESTGSLWVDRGHSLAPVAGWCAPAEAIRRLAIELISAGGRHLDELHPCADVHLGGGIRVHAVLPPIAAAGPAVSIRLPHTETLDFDRLVAGGICDAGTAAELRAAVAWRRNVLVTGGTATGKTTLLAALLGLVPHDERIVTIEDVAELRIAHPHRVALESRRPSAEAVGEVTLAQLLREALRMRPDRIVLGECRGAEVATLLTALNTGHEGGAATLHAGSLAGVPARLEALGALAGLDPVALARQAVAALHLVVHLERSASGARRVAGLGRVTLRGDRIDVEPLR